MILNGIKLFGGISLSIIPPPPTYWIADLANAASFEFGYGIAHDSVGNLYIAGQAGTGLGGNDMIIAKYNPNGELQWQRGLGGAGSDIAYSIATDSSSDVYVTGLQASQGEGGNDIIIAKYNSAGVLQWQRGLAGAGNDIAYSIATDSSSGVYVTGLQGSQGLGAVDIIIAKYNSSGTFQWQQGLGGAVSDIGEGITVDSSGNLYIVGQQQTQGQGGFDIIIAKYNSAGELQWQRGLGGASGDIGRAITTDSADNVYIVGQQQSQGQGVDDIVIAKYNSAGVFQWQRGLGGTAGDIGRAITTDSADNVYITGVQASQGQGGNDVIIAKYNSAGTLQWQRGLGRANGDGGFGITIDPSDNVCISGGAQKTTGNNDIIVAKLPSDGSLTGTYGGLVYYVSTLTETTPTLTQYTPTLTETTPTFVSTTVAIG